MSKTRTDVSRFESAYGGGNITASQYLSEHMSARIAKKEGEALGHFFWKEDRWLKVFKTQLMFANKLLKLYSVESIIRVLRTPKGKKVYSLGAKFIYDEIERESALIEQRKATLMEATPEEPETEKVENHEVRPPMVVKKSNIAKLRDLDE
jgi:hypothetical protein